jgi:hypothetical protein
MAARVDFCGELFQVSPDKPVVLGRDGDITIDDNPFLHRRFLMVSEQDTITWLSNIGSSLTATVSDEEGALQAWLSPGAQLPLIVKRTSVWFTAGPTTYEFDIFIEDAPFVAVPRQEPVNGDTTIGRISLTPDQKLLVLALCEPMLRRGSRGQGTIPSSADAAARLGWTLTRFNRKLDNVCEKFTRAGIRGLHGGRERLATSRRSRLTEYTLAARFVTPEDLPMLDAVPSQRLADD